MIPAEVKKRENIAEYIVHMYQTEDLIVTYNFNLDDILQYVIQHMSKDEQELKELLLWYAAVIDEMQQEKLPQHGKRLKSTQRYVDQLTNIHSNLLEKNAEYYKTYASCEPEINEQIALSDGKISNPVQICLNAVYGKMVINLNGKKLPEAQEKMVEKFAGILASLAREYHKSE